MRCRSNLLSWFVRRPIITLIQVPHDLIDLNFRYSYYNMMCRFESSHWSGTSATWWKDLKELAVLLWGNLNLKNKQTNEKQTKKGKTTLAGFLNSCFETWSWEVDKGRSFLTLTKNVRWWWISHIFSRQKGLPECSSSLNSGIGLPPSSSGAWVGQTQSLTYSFSFTQMQWLVHKHMTVFLRRTTGFQAK